MHRTHAATSFPAICMQVSNGEWWRRRQQGAGASRWEGAGEIMIRPNPSKHCQPATECRLSLSLQAHCVCGPEVLPPRPAVERCVMLPAERNSDCHSSMPCDADEGFSCHPGRWECFKLPRWVSGWRAYKGGSGTMLALLPRKTQGAQPMLLTAAARVPLSCTPCHRGEDDPCTGVDGKYNPTLYPCEDGTACEVRCAKHCSKPGLHGLELSLPAPAPTAVCSKPLFACMAGV